MYNTDVLESLRSYIPNFFSNFIDNDWVDIIKLEDLGAEFLMLSYDEHTHHAFMVGTISKNEDEDHCFDDQHRCFESYSEAKEEFNKILKGE